MECVSPDEHSHNDCGEQRYVCCIVSLSIDMFKFTAGDVQPYVALGKRLVEDGHRVRLATHETFRQFVTNSGLEFFNIGGNPQDLMSYMVKSKRSLQLYESRLKQDY